MSTMRTHNCNELRLSDAGKRVKLAGWMENVREVGSNLAFVVLRDFYGTTQLVIEDEETLKAVLNENKETTIAVEGVVRERSNKNPKLPTGDIEVVPDKVEVLGRCRYSSLPFEINRSREADEAQRLKYRYLDLRNPAVKKNIILRCNVIAAIRQAMLAHGKCHLTSQNDVLLHGVTAQVKIAVLQAQVFVGQNNRSVLLAHFFNGKGEFLRSGKDFDVFCSHFDFAGRHVLVYVFFAAGGNHTFHRDTILAFQAGGDFLQFIGCSVTYHHLRNAIAVTQPYKNNAAQIAGTAYPSVQYNCLTNIALAQIAASNGTLCVFHNMIILMCCRDLGKKKKRLKRI